MLYNLTRKLTCVTKYTSAGYKISITIFYKMEPVVSFNTLIENDDIFDKLIWSISLQSDGFAAPERLDDQLNTLKLVNKTMRCSILRYVSRIKENVSQRYALYLPNHSSIEEYDINMLIKINHYVNEGLVKSQVEDVTYYKEITEAVIPTLFAKFPSFRLRFKGTLSIKALKDFAYNKEQNSSPYHPGIFELPGITQTYIHKYQITYLFVDEKNDSFETMIEHFFIPDHWSHIFPKMLNDYLSKIENFEQDLKLMDDNALHLEFYYDIPTSKSTKNPFMEVLTEDYNISVEYFSYNFEFDPKKFMSQVSMKKDNESYMHFKLDKFVTVCYPSKESMQNDQAFITVNKQSLACIWPQLSPEFKTALCNYESSKNA